MVVLCKQLSIYVHLSNGLLRKSAVRIGYLTKLLLPRSKNKTQLLNDFHKRPRTRLITGRSAALPGKYVNKNSEIWHSHCLGGWQLINSII